jgi:pilus assembly protein Flp/PilA
MSQALLRLYATATALVQDRYNHRKDNGATAVEYGLLVGLIAVAIIGTLVLLGPKLAALFNNVLTQLPAGTPVTG